jgi:hypothetical protein
MCLFRRLMMSRKTHPNDVLLGDANNDGQVNVVDIVTTASYILGNTPATFFFDAADVNRDGKINITDIVGIASIILNTNTAVNTSSKSSRQFQPNNRFYIEDFSMQVGETKTIAINLDNDVSFTGFQADLRLPKGIELCTEDGDYLVDLSTRKGRDHAIGTGDQADESIRILGYSSGLKVFSGNSGALAYLTLKANDDFTSEQTITIDNIVFAQPDMTEYILDATTCVVTKS